MGGFQGWPYYGLPLIALGFSKLLFLFSEAWSTFPENTVPVEKVGKVFSLSGEKKKESQDETQWREQEQEIEHRHLAAAKPSKHLAVQVPACLCMDVPTCSQALCGHFGVLPCAVPYELDPVDTLEDSPCIQSGFRSPHNVQETAFNEWWEEGHSSVSPFPMAHHWPGTQQGRTSK